MKIIEETTTEYKIEWEDFKRFLGNRDASESNTTLYINKAVIRPSYFPIKVKVTTKKNREQSTSVKRASHAGS